MNPQVSIEEARHLCIVVYILGILTPVLVLLVARLLADWRADRRREARFQIHRRTPFRP
jgi:hypothetical protein